ncbi:chaperone [Lithospermum erythrorhizon]|uniref:Chaperone n=1 Tax=Lithospermum erythrorhizon TaxID=34254 RepID=A0AAV3PMX4_LITER
MKEVHHFDSLPAMAFLTRLFNCRATRLVHLYTHHQLYSFPYSNNNLKPSKHNYSNDCNKLLDESFVINQLSELIPAISRKPIKENTCNKQLDIEFVPIEERLRGVFLQKLCGKNAIFKAFDDVGVEVSVELVAKVVNKGNLSGEFIVLFFNWAIEKSGVAERINFYHVVFKALGRRKFFKHLMDLLDDMRSRGVNPNAESLLIVVDSFVRANQVTKAMKMFGRLEEFGFEFNVEFLNTMLGCLCQRGHVGVASKLLGKMRGKIAFDGTTYNMIIGGWARSGRVGEVEKFLQEMVDDGYDPDCLTYGYILEGLGRSGKVDESVKVFQSLVESGTVLKAGVYNAMISNFVCVRNIDESLNYYHQMLRDKCDPDMDTYSGLVSTLLSGRRVADAIEMFDQMLDRGMVPKTGTVTSFLEPLCSYGPPHAALMIYKKAKKSGCRISLSAYKLLLSRLSKFGKCGMLLSLWNEMQESGYSSDMEVYEYIINGLCNIGHLENAVLLMEEALKEGFFPSRLICSKLNNKLLAANKVERAYKLFLKIKAARLSENTQRHWRAKGWHF